MQPTHDPNSTQPLVMRSYRRHRRQSRWGSYSLFAPVAALLWAVFWYLMINRPQLPGAEGDGSSSQWIVLLVGAEVLSAVGIALAAAGMLDVEHRREYATIGLALNAVVLVGVAVALFFHLFSQAVT